jgi:hypothetical protein
MHAAFVQSKTKRDEVQRRLDKLTEGETLAQQHEAYRRAGYWSQVEACGGVIADAEHYLVTTVRGDDGAGGAAWCYIPWGDRGGGGGGGGGG